ncbi:hypothetical protein TSTA_073120 [Talaromyces stipitatus ATCC 10500]|uniref:Uncharacterized protein n=1 Tax=Talaromyces stipitatus (strain ATCC 10500 / CBS 375.48 / QM 6759 / NRRL 1006) TaxID=441959 RepID=B8LUR5_TALSN|nr:uncharacterized protein TSTA_073120 [Talaromyces stipitatus ATCC 10500]EED23922.1 hypothetical protein TSTA_073120 [Talaromyces stipitatus ATCC 10500]
MADIAETVSQPQDSDKPSESKSSESIAQNIASAALQGGEILAAQQQLVYIPQQQQQVQQQSTQATQTMTIMNNQFVPVSTSPVQVPTSAASPVPVVLPQVQISVHSQPTAVSAPGSIVQKQASVLKEEKKNDAVNKLEKPELSSAQIAAVKPHDPKKPLTTSTQLQTNANTNPNTATMQSRDRGCGLCTAIKKLFQGMTEAENNDNKKDDNQTNTANNGTQDNNTGGQSLGNNTMKMVMQAVMPAPGPAAQNTTSYSSPLTANDNNTTTNASNDQGVNAIATNMTIPNTVQVSSGDTSASPNLFYMIPSSGQPQTEYLMTVQQPLTVVGSPQVAVVPAVDSEVTTNQAIMDGTNMDSGGFNEEEEGYLVDDEDDDGTNDYVD